MPSTKITINITEDKREKFKEACSDNKSNMSRELSLFIDEYIDRPEKFMRSLTREM